jgi:hypothetical protein
LAYAQKTLPHGTEADVTTFLNRIPSKERREDAFKLVEMMRRATGEKPVMWGSAIVGFGTATYSHAGGREGVAPKLAFSPRSSSLVVYLPLWRQDLRKRLADLGPHRASVSCLYIKRLADLDLDAFSKLLADAFKSNVPFPGRKRSTAKPSAEKVAKRTDRKPSTKRASTKKPGRTTASRKGARKV